MIGGGDKGREEGDKGGDGKGEGEGDRSGGGGGAGNGNTVAVVECSKLYDRGWEVSSLLLSGRYCLSPNRNCSGFCRLGSCLWPAVCTPGRACVVEEV